MHLGHMAVEWVLGGGVNLNEGQFYLWEVLVDGFHFFGYAGRAVTVTHASIPIGLLDSMRQGHMAVECVLGGGVNLN